MKVINNYHDINVWVHLHELNTSCKTDCIFSVTSDTKFNYSVCSNMFTQKDFGSDNMFYSEELEDLTPEFYNKHFVATNRIFYHN